MSMGQFNEQVYEVVKQIPPGRVASYGQVARMIGRPRNARFVLFLVTVLCLKTARSHQALPLADQKPSVHFWNKRVFNF